MIVVRVEFLHSKSLAPMSNNILRSEQNAPNSTIQTMANTISTIKFARSCSVRKASFPYVQPAYISHRAREYLYGTFSVYLPYIDNTRRHGTDIVESDRKI